MLEKALADERKRVWVSCLSQDGVLMAGRFGPGWTVTDHKCKSLFVESPAALEMARSFCSANTMVFDSLAFATDSITRTGFDPSAWLPRELGWSMVMPTQQERLMPTRPCGPMAL